MRGRQLTNDPHSLLRTVAVVEQDDAGPDFDGNYDRPFTVDEWGLWLTRLAKRAGRGRVDDRRACRLAIVGSAGLRAAIAREEREIEREKLVQFAQWQRQLQQQPQQPRFDDYDYRPAAGAQSEVTP